MVAETENCMKSLNQTTINDASVRQTMCDKTLGHQVWQSNFITINNYCFFAYS
jgi:hypothetical protein